MGVHRGAESYSLWRRPTLKQVDAQKEAMTLWKAYSRADSWQDLKTHGKPMLEQFVKNCSPWEGLTLEKLIEDCLLWEAPHS
ncbi:hypothetical protein BTVI_113888 [Pitangus sulphuratus]|nr:hypothetical protein BTVI_113888 [Pitangus sulphuratus]